jgi:structural maintenance of chromosomes protein 5
MLIHPKNCVGALRKQNDQQHEAELWLIEASSEVETLQEHSKDVRILIAARKQAVQELNQDSARLLQVCKKLKTEFLRLQDTFSNEEQAIAAEVCANSTIEELDGEMTTIKQRMELVTGGSPLIVQLFEKRATEIEQLTEKINQIEGDMEGLDGEIRSTREKWEPELDKLVKEISDAFSHNFDQIGCAGQVGITKKEDDFGQWAIEIQVKFR